MAVHLVSGISPLRNVASENEPIGLSAFAVAGRCNRQVLIGWEVPRKGFLEPGRDPPRRGVRPGSGAGFRSVLFDLLG